MSEPRSFLQLNNILLYGWTTFCLLICHSGGFQCLAAMNDAAMNMCVYVPEWTCVFSSVQVQLLGHMVTPCFTFRGVARRFSKVAALPTLPQQCLHILTSSCCLTSWHWSLTQLFFDGSQCYADWGGICVWVPEFVTSPRSAAAHPARRSRGGLCVRVAADCAGAGQPSSVLCSPHQLLLCQWV